MTCQVGAAIGRSAIHGLLDRDRSRLPGRRRGLHAGIAYASLAMVRVDCPGAFATKVKVTTVPCPEIPPAAGRPGSGNLQGSGGVIVAMDQRDCLAILRKEPTVRNVHHLQHFRIVADLQRHGITLLRPPEQNIDRESRTLGLRKCWPDRS